MLHVAVGIIENTQAQQLVASCKYSTPANWVWEYPGGKCEAGESTFTALQRELNEELGITVEHAEFLRTVVWEYPQKKVALHVFLITHFHGQPRGKEGQQLHWKTPRELLSMSMPAADRPLLMLRYLPQYYVISSEPQDQDVFLTTLHTHAQCKNLLQIRIKNIDKIAYAQLLRDYQKNFNADMRYFIINTHIELALEFELAGVHLTAAQLMCIQERPLSARFVVGASCHNADELRHALAIGCDFVTLSPIKPTASHHHVEPLGYEIAQQMIADYPLPVFFLGGMQKRDIAKAKQYGAFGVAGIDDFWKA